VQNKTIQNKTKQHRTKQNKTKQNKMKQNIATKRAKHIKIKLTDMIDYKRGRIQWES
jgi:hypothetical protein